MLYHMILGPVHALPAVGGDAALRPLGDLVTAGQNH